MRITLESQDTDHADFVRLVESIICNVVDEFAPREVHIIRIRGWFDH